MCVQLPPQVDIWMTHPINSIIKIKNVVKFQDLNRKKMLSGALKKVIKYLYNNVIIIIFN